MKLIVFFQTLFALSVLSLIAAIGKRKRKQTVKFGLFQDCSPENTCLVLSMTCYQGKCLKKINSLCDENEECASGICKAKKDQIKKCQPKPFV